MSTDMERDERLREAVDSDPYANAVIDVLRSDFPDLNDPMIASIVRKHIYAHAHTPGGGLEIIVDDPYFANWRLVPLWHGQGRVRLACWRVPTPASDQERERRLNAALNAID